MVIPVVRASINNNSVIAVAMAARKHWLVDLSTLLDMSFSFFSSTFDFSNYNLLFDILVHRSSVFLIHGSSLPNPDLHVATYSPIYYCSLPGNISSNSTFPRPPACRIERDEAEPDRRFLHRGPWYADLVPLKHVRPDVRRPALCRFTTPFSRKYSSSSCIVRSATAQPSPQS